MLEPEHLRGGELNAAVTSALVGIHTAHLGRGPTTASTFHYGNVVVTLMHGVMTPAEQTLATTGNAPAVTAMRHLFQDTMQGEFSAAIERLTGRSVVATGNAPAVTAMRHLFQDTMQGEFSAAIERLTGRSVVAFISGNHMDPDMAAELFVLDGAIGPA